MIWRIKHTTRYAYTGPVYCEPMIIRLRPRDDASQRLLRFGLSIDPEPIGTCELLEPDGHVATRAWFSNLTCHLAVTSLATVETTLINPFNFLLEPYAVALPFRYHDDLAPQLTTYLHPGDCDELVSRTATAIARETGSQTLGFVSRAAGWIKERFEREVRRDGSARAPADTLQRGHGSCRDLAVLYNAMCRSVGLAARFVSGYHVADDDPSDLRLHAWSEVYLPGAGWRGFDPSLGLAVADRHVPVAAAWEPRAVTPTCGSFRGTGVESSIAAQIVIRTASELPAVSMQTQVCCS